MQKDTKARLYIQSREDEMEMDKRTHNQTMGVIVLMVAVTCVVAYYSLRSTQRQSLAPLTVKDPQPATTTIPTLPASDEENPQAAGQPITAAAGSALPEIVVHVAGAVLRPDVYRLSTGSRVDDAIRAAGGATQNADTNSINLAAPVQDGSKVYVPQYGEQAAQQPVQVSRSSGAGPSSPTPATQQAQSGQEEAEAPTGNGDHSLSSGKLTDASQGAVNINTASVDELQRLPGIGPAIAQRIVDYRQANGAFKSAEDLKNVSGIGEKKYAKLAAYVTVG